MVSNVGSFTQTITGNTAKPLGAYLINAAPQSKSVFAEALAKSTTAVAETLTPSGVEAAATVTQTAVKRSFFSKVIRFLSGDFAEDVTNAFANRKNTPFKDGFKKSFNFKTACKEAAQGVKEPGKIGKAIAKVFPFVKNTKFSKLGKIINTSSISTLIIYGMQLLPIYKAFKKYGSSEGIKETLKFGITVGCMAAAEAVIAILSVYTGGIAGFLKLFAPVIGSQIGIWLGKKILGKSAEEKERDNKIAQHNQQLQELVQNPQMIQMLQQNPTLLQQMQQDPDLTDRIYQNLKQQKVTQNPQNLPNGQNLQNQTANNTVISPEEQQRRYAYASQFGNPYLTTSLGNFSNLVYNVDAPFAQMVARHDSLYNPFQSLALSQQINNDLAAHGYIFG